MKIRLSIVSDENNGPKCATEVECKGEGHWDYFAAVLEGMQALIRHEAIRASNKERHEAVQDILEKENI